MNNEKIALLAGSGYLPVVIAKRLDDIGLLSLLIVLQGKKERFDFFYKGTIEIALGNVKRVLNTLQKKRINSIIMIGKIDKNGFIERQGLDARALQMLEKIKDGKDTTIFHLILDELEKIDVKVLPQDTYIKDMIVGHDMYTKKKPTTREMEDAVFGIEHARNLATMDIGQTVVVKNKTILAVEAVEGTNEAIKRGGLLGKGSSVVCKSARKKQDRRFDIPVIGMDTIKVMAEYGCNTLAMESGKIIMLNRNEVTDYVNKLDISIITI